MLPQPGTVIMMQDRLIKLMQKIISRKVIEMLKAGK